MYFMYIFNIELFVIWMYWVADIRIIIAVIV